MTHYVLLRNAVQLAAADHRYARLRLQEPAADPDDELPPLNDDDDIEDEDVTDEADQPIVADGNQEVSSLYIKMGTGRQAKDPAPTNFFPRFSGAGKKMSWRTRQWRQMNLRLVATIAFMATHLLLKSGKGLGINHASEHFDGDGPDSLHKDLWYFRYNSCRLSATTVLSCALRDRQVEQRRGTLGEDVRASSFALVQLPDWLATLKRSLEDDLVPVRIITYAGVVWKPEHSIHRVAYVKILPYVIREASPGTGQMIFQVAAKEVSEWGASARVRCIPLECLRTPLILIRPSTATVPQPLCNLIPTQGKRLGLVNRIDPETGDDDIPDIGSDSEMSD